MKVVAEESYDDAPMPLGCIDISWPNVGKFTIFDNELFTALGGLAQYKNFVNAVILSQMLPKYVLLKMTYVLFFYMNMK